jgi:PAS domain S-box-containing protein
MKHKPAPSAPAAAQREEGGPGPLQARIKALELELEQKNVLLEQGFAAFTQAAEKLQESHKRLRLQVAQLNLELEEKNRELESNLAEREKVKTYLSNIFESLPVGVFVMDLQGAITSVNHAGLDMIGLGAEALVGENVNEMFGTEVFPRAAGERAGSNGEVDDEASIAYRRPDGETLQMTASLTPMRGEGRPLGYILNVQDVTLLKQLEEQADRRNRFTAMGEMAANIAHEIRNPLGSIELFASLVKKGLGEDDEQWVMMNHISSGIASMNHIISNVLEYTKPRPVNLKRLELHRLLREIGEFSRYMAEQNGVRVAFDLEEGEGKWVRGDEDLLRQVFHNLVLNAVQAMTEGGTVTISSRARNLTHRKVLSRFGTVPRRKDDALDILEVAFQDTGPGIPRELQKKIFDPFFTTRSRGTGLGLAIVHNIIESHHATIDVESEEHKGARFVFMFPLV